MKKLLFYSLIALLGLASCSSDSEPECEYIPFQETEDGLWGMIAPDGEVLFKEEFKNQPTMAIEGRFMVKNEKGRWQIFTAEKKPRQVGSEYIGVTEFHNGRALAVEPNKPITLIDKEGKVVKTLDKIGGKPVTKASEFSEGLARVQIGEDWGMIDLDGNLVVPADYCELADCGDGKVLGIHKKYRETLEQGEKKAKICVMDKKGTVLYSINIEKYEYVTDRYVEGCLKVAQDKGGETCYGLLDEKGEWKLKPSAKWNDLRDIANDKIIFYHNDGYGLANLQGEVIIRSKYKSLRFADNELLLAQKEGDENEKYILIDQKEQEVSKEDFFDYLGTFKKFGGKGLFVKLAKKEWGIMTPKGELLKELPDIVNVDYALNDTYVESDFLDVPALLDAAGLKKDGCDGMTLSDKAQKVAAHFSAITKNGNDQYPGSHAYWYDYRKRLEYSKDLHSVSVDFSVRFSENLSEGNWLTSTYTFKNITPIAIGMAVQASGKAEGKTKMIYDGMASRVKAMGKVVKENKNAVVVKQANGYVVFAFNNGQMAAVTIFAGGDATEIDIAPYADVKADGSNAVDASDSDIDLNVQEVSEVEADTVVAAEEYYE